jgi:hypothetical protein
MSEPLTSKSEIEEVFSAEGLENHLADLINNEPYMTRVISQSSERVYMYLRTQYDESQIEINVIARQIATYIACYNISIRAGNPSLYADAYAQGLIDLEQIRDGILNPGMASKARAVVQTPMLDNRFYNPKRVNVQGSTRVFPKQNMPRYPFNLNYD